MAMANRNKFLGLVILLFLVFAASCEARGSAPRRGIAWRGPVARRGRRPAGPVHRRDPSEKVFNVLQFGAKANGKTDSALNFIRAWRAACDYRGKARLLIPAGNFLAGATVFQGPCQGPSPIIVQIAGNVKALPDPSSYEEDYWISFENVNGLIVSGTGILDGQGNRVWKYNNCKSGGLCNPFPITMKLYNVKAGIIRQITSVNPMGFHIGVVDSQNIRLRRLHLYAPANSPNTDGIHISQSNQVRIARSIISTGDDCVGMIRGSTDVSIKKVTCGPGHGFSIGSLGKYPDEEDVRGITVQNCTLRGTENGIRIKTFAGSPPSQATNMIFEDITMDNVRNPIIIDQAYESNSKPPSRVKISDIQYINIRGTTASDVAVNIECSKQFPCERVRLSNINLKYIGPSKKQSSSVCANVKPTYSGLQFPPACA